MKKKKLFYFTNSFPYGFGETWKTNELNVLVNYFEEIVIVPFCYGDNKENPKKVDSRIKVAQPIFEKFAMVTKTRDLYKLFDRNVFYYLNEFFSKKVFLSKARFNSWRTFSFVTKGILENPVIKDIIENGDESYVLYFFWGTQGTEFLPILYKKKKLRTIVKFHRFDLYDYLYPDKYVPYRDQLLNSITIAAPSSNDGYMHMKKKHPLMKCKLMVLPLGVIQKGVVSKSNDDVFRILSCSFVSEPKRVHLIAEALMFLNIPVVWTHVGDGELMDILKEKISNLPPNIKVELPGIIKTDQLMEFYFARQIDLFVNVSSSEGVPISIMEALSCGIPVFATNVGGTSDVVDDSVGKLLAADFVPEELAKYFVAYYKNTEAIKDEYRNMAYLRYKKKCDSIKITNQLGRILIDE